MSESTGAAAAARAVKWSALTTMARIMLQLAAQVALARMLGPGNFGVYGIGMVVLTFATFLSGSTFSWSLMLLPAVSREDIRFSFSWQLVAGLVTSAAMYALAPAIAVFFADQRVEGVVQLLSLASLLIAAGAPATCLLQRELNFRALGLIQLASYAAGYLAVGVPMALNGYGPYSLAAACVVQAAVALVATYAAKPHSLRPLFFYPHASATLTTGRAVILTNIVNWLLSNLDRVIIGRLLNAHAVGLYNVAYNLASIPNTLLLGTLQPTFLSFGAKLQQEPNRLAQAWLHVMAFVLVMVTPASIVFALLSQDLVSLLYGPAWMESGWVLAVLFLYLPAWACFAVSTPILWNTGRKHQEFLLQLPLLAVAVSAWWLFGSEGIRAVAMVSVAVVVARAGVIVAAALAALKLPWSAVLPLALRGLGLAAVCAGAVLAGQRVVAPLALPVLSLVAGGLCALSVLLLIVGICPQVLGSEAKAAISKLFPALGRFWDAPRPSGRIFGQRPL